MPSVLNAQRCNGVFESWQWATWHLARLGSQFCGWIQVQLIHSQNILACNTAKLTGRKRVPVTWFTTAISNLCVISGCPNNISGCPNNLPTLQHHPKRHTSWQTIRWNVRKPQHNRIQTTLRQPKHLGRAHSRLQPTWLTIERSLPKREDRKLKSKPKINHKVRESKSPWNLVQSPQAHFWPRIFDGIEMVIALTKVTVGRARTSQEQKGGVAPALFLSTPSSQPTWIEVIEDSLSSTRATVKGGVSSCSVTLYDCASECNHTHHVLSAH